MLKVLLLDIETAPKIVYSWGTWQQNIYENQIEQDMFMLTWSAKWLGDDTVYGDRLDHYEALEGNDKRLVSKLWIMMDEADVIVGHNSNKFDLPIINTRFILNRLSPPSPYRKIDTLAIAKRVFSFTYNKLDYLGRMLANDKKKYAGGMETWKRCLRGDELALQKMLDYNKQDVLLLEKVYYELAPYAPSLPNHSVNGETCSCPKCGSHNLHRRGYAYTNSSRFQRFRCVDCGGWSRGRKDTRTKTEKENTLMPSSY